MIFLHEFLHDMAVRSGCPGMNRLHATRRGHRRVREASRGTTVSTSWWRCSRAGGRDRFDPHEKGWDRYERWRSPPIPTTSACSVTCSKPARRHVLEVAFTSSVIERWIFLPFERRGLGHRVRSIREFPAERGARLRRAEGRGIMHWWWWFFGVDGPSVPISVLCGHWPAKFREHPHLAVSAGRRSPTPARRGRTIRPRGSERGQ